MRVAVALHISKQLYLLAMCLKLNPTAFNRLSLRCRA